MVIAHRGASAQFAEHTEFAYAQAIEAGADALECDVRLTRDAQLVCVHDRTVDRTSNGHGIVAERTLDQLKSLDFSSWKGAPEQFPEGVLTLVELLDLIKSAPRPVRLYIETKHPSRFSGLVEKELVGVLGEYGWLSGEVVTVMSFAELALRRLRLLAPELPRVLLLDRIHRRIREGQLPGATSIAGPSLALLRRHPELVDQVHRHDGQILVWTVNEPGDVRFARDLGVDAIITDDPAATIATLKTVDEPEPDASEATPTEAGPTESTATSTDVEATTAD
jgi:glycerophosphoryl diester phosphodiesterase